RFEIKFESLGARSLRVRSDGSRVLVRGGAMSREEALAFIEPAVLALGLVAPGTIVARPPARSLARQLKFDAVISHATEDKSTVAQPLHDALEERGYRVWLDKLDLRVGDPLRRSIESGLG